MLPISSTSLETSDDYVPPNPGDRQATCNAQDLTVQDLDHGPQSPVCQMYSMQPMQTGSHTRAFLENSLCSLLLNSKTLLHATRAARAWQMPRP